ncbi:MAG: paraquat-inducible protein A, partial [Stellaceae bacterium]
NTQVFLACRDCGQIHSVTDRLPTDRWLLCRRCGRRLWRSPLGTLDRPLAYAAAAIILFGLVNTFALFEIGFVGDHRSGMIISGAIQLTRYSPAIAGVGVLVALISIIIPALTLVLIFAVLARLVSAIRGKARARLGLAGGWRLALRLRPWSMLDVYLLGAVVAYTRLRRLADVVVGAGGYALAALVFVQVLIEQSLGRQRVWHAIGDPAQYGPKPGKPWILCLDCELVTAVHTTGSDGRRRCPRCGARLAPRRPGSLATTAAFTLASYILYLPANVLPVLTITRFGRTEPYTILGGVRDLAAAGLWPLALLVLFASIIVPVLKLAGLSWFLIAIRLRSARLLRERTAFYRLIDFIGRWSNIDVFMISIVSALLQFGILTTVDPGTGIASFAAVVALTMIATRAFDPRLTWDAAAEVRH